MRPWYASILHAGASRQQPAQDSFFAVAYPNNLWIATCL